MKEYSICFKHLRRDCHCTSPQNIWIWATGIGAKIRVPKAKHKYKWKMFKKWLHKAYRNDMLP